MLDKEQKKPCLLVLATGQYYPLESGRLVLIGRSQKCDICIDGDIQCSRKQCKIELVSNRVVLTPISETSPTFLNGKRLTAETKLSDGDEIKFSSSSIKFCNPNQQRLHQAKSVAARQKVSKLLDISFAKNTLIGREKNLADLVLEHLSVSRKHAEVIVKKSELWIKDLKSSNGTFVNGKKIKSTTRLRSGDRIDIGPYSLQLGGSNVATATTRDGSCSLIAYHLSRKVGHFSNRRTILDNVSLALDPNEFVCLLGPSGSGKTTLLNALSARQPADEGSVRINGIGLYANFEALKENISLVPQHDVLHDELSLKEVLKYTAQLRLPKDISNDDLQETISSALSKVELTDHMDTAIRNLSGGQKKRASLANETISKPSLLFLDEVTSGLDEATDWEMMRLFRMFADQGLLVICVTHMLSNVEEFCHKVVIMAAPGVIAFYGTPKEAKEYFGVSKLGDIYRVLPNRPGKEWHKIYVESEYYESLSDHESDDTLNGPSEETKERDVRRLGLAEIARQFGILSHRNINLLFKNKKVFGMAILQSGLISALLAVVFSQVEVGHPSELALVFLLGISSFWLGCNGAAKEIVKERIIYRRERDVRLSVFAYLSSKMLVYGLFVLLQVGVLFLVFDGIARVPGDKGIQLLQMMIAALTGTSLGMLISASCSTQEQANTIVPMALIPQLVLAGVIVPELPTIPDFIGRVFTDGYWSYVGMKSAMLAQIDMAQILKAVSIQTIHIIGFLSLAYGIMLFKDRSGKK